MCWPPIRRSCLLLTTLLTPLVAQEPVAPKELGRVVFSRDLDARLRHKPDKPLFVLFQEIPG